MDTDIFDPFIRLLSCLNVSLGSAYKFYEGKPKKYLSHIQSALRKVFCHYTDKDEDVEMVAAVSTVRRPGQLNKTGLTAHQKAKPQVEVKFLMVALKHHFLETPICEENLPNM